MAAGVWTVFNKAKKKIGNGTMSLAATTWRMTLHTSAMSALLTLSTYASLGGEVTEANGYSSSGKGLVNEVWTVGASAGQYKFDADDVFWSGNAGTISNIKHAAIHASAAAGANQHLLCKSQLSASQFSISAGNRLTIQMNAAGILTLA